MVISLESKSAMQQCRMLTQTRVGDVNSGIYSIKQEIVHCKNAMWLNIGARCAQNASNLHISK